jgi:hypothetical protein
MLFGGSWGECFSASFLIAISAFSIIWIGRGRGLLGILMIVFAGWWLSNERSCGGRIIDPFCPSALRGHTTAKRSWCICITIATVSGWLCVVCPLPHHTNIYRVWNFHRNQIWCIFLVAPIIDASLAFQLDDVCFPVLQASKRFLLQPLTQQVSSINPTALLRPTYSWEEAPATSSPSVKMSVGKTWMGRMHHLGINVAGETPHRTVGKELAMKPIKSRTFLGRMLGERWFCNTGGYRPRLLNVAGNHASFSHQQVAISSQERPPQGLLLWSSDLRTTSFLEERC